MEEETNLKKRRNTPVDRAAQAEQQKEKKDENSLKDLGDTTMLPTLIVRVSEGKEVKNLKKQWLKVSLT